MNSGSNVTNGVAPVPSSAGACGRRPQQALRTAKHTKWPTVGSGHSKCRLGKMFWEHQEHEVAYSWLQAFEMLPGNGVLGTRRARSGLQLAPGIQNVAWELCFGNTKSTKWPTVGSGHPKCGMRIVLFEQMWPGNTVFGKMRHDSGEESQAILSYDFFRRGLATSKRRRKPRSAIGGPNY